MIVVIDDFGPFAMTSWAIRYGNDYGIKITRQIVHQMHTENDVITITIYYSTIRRHMGNKTMDFFLVRTRNYTRIRLFSFLKEIRVLLLFVVVRRRILFTIRHRQ